MQEQEEGWGVEAAEQDPYLAEEQGPSNEKDWLLGAHLSTLSSFVIPLGGLLGPLLVYFVKRDQPNIRAHAASAFNFQLIMTGLAMAILVLGLVLFAITESPVVFVVFLPLIPIGLAALIFPIIAAVKANKGEQYQYPIYAQILS